MVLGRSAGGIGTHVQQLTAELERIGHEVVVVTDAATADRFGWTRARRWWPGDPLAAIRWRPRMGRLLAGADVVHAHGLQAGALVAVALAARRRRPRSVVSLHNRPPDRPLPQVTSGLLRRMARSADLVTGASTDLVDQARSWGARRAELAPVPAPQVPRLLAQPVPTPAERASLAAELLGDPDPLPLLVTISRIAPQKALGTLVEAGGQLSTAVVWAVLGDGDVALRRDLEVRARGTGVRFLGATQDVAVWLRAATLFVLPSAWEARPLVVQEAMAAGTPVLATDVGGLSELVGDAGVLVPAGDPRALAEAVQRLLDDEQGLADLSRRGRITAKTWPDGNASARRWVSWYSASA